MPKQSLIKGTIVLSIAAFLTKLLGFINGMVLARVIGSEGVGLLMMTMPAISLLIALTTLGLDIAISKLVAEYDLKNNHLMIKRVLIISLFATLTISFILIIGLFASSHILLPIILIDKRAYYAFIAAILIVPITAVVSVFKGYFRGKQYMSPIAFAQIIEQISRICLIFLIAQWLMQFGIEYAVAGTVICGILGELFSLFYMAIRFKKIKSTKFTFHHSLLKEIKNGKKTLTNLLEIGLPMTGNNLIRSVGAFLQPIVIMHSLRIAGVDSATGTGQYGVIMGFAMPLLFLPHFISNSLSVSLIPSISEAYAQNNFNLIHRRIQQAVQLSLMIGLPWTIILYFFPDILTTTFYNSKDAAIFVKMLAPMFLLQFFRIPFSSIIIGLGKAKAVMFNNIFTTILTLLLMFILASSPELGINGVALALCMEVVLGTLLHFFTIVKLIGFTINIKILFKIIISGILMSIISLMNYKYLEIMGIDKLFSLIILLTTSLSIYCLLLFLFKLFSFSKPIKNHL